MSRQVFDGAVTWAMKADKTHFWKSQSTKSKTISKPETAKEGLVAAARKTGGPRASVSRTEEYVSVFFIRIDYFQISVSCFRDEANIAKLQQLGMTSMEETKLLALRDYIIKLANVISR